MRPALIPIPLFPWRVRALWPNLIAYRWGGRVTIQSLSREMVRLTQMQSLGYFPYLIFHLLFPRVCRHRRHSWETVHYGEAMEVLKRHGFHI